MRRPTKWRGAVLALLLVVIAVLFWTGRLQFQWRPMAQEGSAHKNGDSHDHGKEEHREGEQRVSGDKAVLDAETIKAAGIKTAPVEKGSVAVTIQVTGEVELPDTRMAHVTARLAGVVREVLRNRGDRVTVGTPLAVIESGDLGEVRAAYLTAVTDARVADANFEAWQRHRQSGSGASESGGSAGWVELDQALADLASAEAERAVVDRHLARLRELHERGLRSRTDLLAAEADANRTTVRADAARRRLHVLGAVARTERDRARQRLDTAAAKLRALGVEPGDIAKLGAEGSREASTRFWVRSPIAGVVSDRQVTVGQTVEATAKIFAIADLSEVWVTAALHDKDATAVRPGMAAIVSVQGISNGTFKGQVVQIGPQVDEKTRTLPVRVALRNVPMTGSGDSYVLRPGMFAMVDLEMSRKSGVALIPSAAIQSLGGQTVIFVETPLTEGAAFQRRPVVLGARDGDSVEIVEGLAPGERVVIANAYLLKSEFERSKISHGHAH
jgi:cobalt-zinc-cadmium efflux system membrane fusion protein